MPFGDTLAPIMRRSATSHRTVGVFRPSGHTQTHNYTNAGRCVDLRGMAGGQQRQTQLRATRIEDDSDVLVVMSPRNGICEWVVALRFELVASSVGRPRRPRQPPAKQELPQALSKQKCKNI